ncbi:MAG TPA: type II toxin-antitoxin system RatA family toxin [Pseudomonadales bacterium]
MSHIHRHALLPYSDAQMFALVNDVAAYPEYLAGCAAAIVHEQREDAMLATLQLAKKGVRMQFTTRNVLDAPKSIVMQLEDGPFDSFEGRWFFQSLRPDACKVVLDLQFSLNNRMLAVASRTLFDSVSHSMVDAMVQRAKVIYGR